MNQSSAHKNKEVEEMMAAYYSYIGGAHIDNEVAYLEDNKDKISDIDLSETLEAKMTGHFKSFEQENRRRKLKVKLRRFAISAAVFLAIVITSLSILTLSVEAFRIKLFNFFVDKTETHTTVKVEERSDSLVEADLWQGAYWLSYLPDGYIFSNKEIFNDTKLQLYTSEDHGLITFGQGKIGAVFQLDTEAAQTKEVMVNGFKGIIAEKASINILFWSNEDASFYLTGPLETELLIEMAEKIEKK